MTSLASAAILPSRPPRDEASTQHGQSFIATKPVRKKRYSQWPNTARFFRFQRFLEHGRALCDRWLPPEARRLQTPSSWSPELRRFAVSLALAEPAEIAAAADAPPISPSAARRVTLRLGGEEWTIRLRPVKKSWVFDSGLRRVP